jgi:His-Xaa-Ser system radical SAM maturase HxsB
MQYQPVALPFNARALPSGAILAVSESGDHSFLSNKVLHLLRNCPDSLDLGRQAHFRSRFILGSAKHTPGMSRLLASRQAAKRETTTNGPALHIFVPTLQCAHSCKYCQVSRSLTDTGHTMSVEALDAACDSIFESSAPSLTVEFQGGDPLLRFDLLERAVIRIVERNKLENRKIRFVIASTLHQLDSAMCDFFAEHGVFLSTSIDGPAWLHNKNRPTPTRDSHERTCRALELARSRLGHESVSALMTTTKESLSHPEAIVDEYVRLGFRDIFLRPLSSYGFAKRNQALLGYSSEAFFRFYEAALARVLHWNREGVQLREVYASVILNKILSTFDGGYVDLQSPTGAGSSVLVYNYDGYVYPSDEARMLAETGDTTLRLGKIGQSVSALLASPLVSDLKKASQVDEVAGCQTCAYKLFCAPNPVDAQAQFQNIFAPVLATEHCHRHMWLFDHWFDKLREANPWEEDLFHEWASPAEGAEASCVA